MTAFFGYLALALLLSAAGCLLRAFTIDDDLNAAANACLAFLWLAGAALLSGGIWLTLWLIHS